MNLAEAVEAWRLHRAGAQRIPLAVTGAVWRGVEAGMTTREIGDVLGVPVRRIASVMRQAGMSSRVRAGRPRKDRVTPTVDLWDDRPFSLLDVVEE